MLKNGLSASWRSLGRKLLSRLRAMQKNRVFSMSGIKTFMEPVI